MTDPPNWPLGPTAARILVACLEEQTSEQLRALPCISNIRENAFAQQRLRLQERKWLHARACPEDSRKRLYTTTLQGIEVLQEFRTLLEEILD
jgi:hypothetical protein